MIQIRRRIGEGFTVADVVVTHVLKGGRHGLKVSVPDGTEFTLFVGHPSSQLRIGIIADGHDVVRNELTRRADERRRDKTS